MQVDGKKLHAYVQRYQDLDARKKEAAEDQAQLLEDMETLDFIEKKPFRALIKYLKDEDEARDQQTKFDNLLALYINFENTPLGQYAAKDVTTVMIKSDGASEIVGTVADIKDAIKKVRRTKTPLAAE